MLSQRGEGAPVAARTPSVKKPSQSRQAQNKAIVHCDTNRPVCHVSRSLGALRALRDFLIVVLALALFALACIVAGAIVSHLPPFTAVVIGGALFVGVLLAIVWREARP